MIKVSIKEDHITISGHSGYSVSGSDIVCASVSSIAITSINAIIRIDEQAISYQKEDGFLDIKIVKHTDTIDLLIDNMIDLLIELEEQYSKYIKINKWGGVTYEQIIFRYPIIRA